MGLDDVANLVLGTSVPEKRTVELILQEAFDVAEVNHPDLARPVKAGWTLRALRQEVATHGGVRDLWDVVHPADLSPWEGRDPDDTYVRTLFRPIGS